MPLDTVPFLEVLEHPQDDRQALRGTLARAYAGREDGGGGPVPVGEINEVEKWEAQASGLFAQRISGARRSCRLSSRAACLCSIHILPAIGSFGPNLAEHVPASHALPS